MKHPIGVISTLSCALLATLAACHQPGSTADASAPQTASSANPTPTPTDPALTAGKPFVGRWKVDLKAVADMYPDDRHDRTNEIQRMQGYSLDIGQDGTAMINGEWFRWTSDGTILSSGEPDARPRNTRLRMMNNTSPPAPQLQIQEKMYMYRGGGSSVFNAAAKEPDTRPEPVYFTYPLIAEKRGSNLKPADVAGEWRLDFEETEQAIKSAWDASLSAGADRESLWYGDEPPSIEKQLKDSMTAPPTYIFRITDAAAPQATLSAKEGRTGTGEMLCNGGVVTSFSFDLWQDTVVTYTHDGWHGIKPNRDYIRIIDGRLRAGGLVLKRVK